MTTYVILEQVEPANDEVRRGPTWVEHGKAEGASDRAAISTFLKGDNGEDGTFVAVPERSFKPVVVAIESRVAFK